MRGWFGLAILDAWLGVGFLAFGRVDASLLCWVVAFGCLLADRRGCRR